MDQNGQLCIYSHDLLSKILSLDPEREMIFTELGDRLSIKYKSKINVFLQNHLIAINFEEGSLDKEILKRKITRDVKKLTGLNVIIFFGSSMDTETIGVRLMNPFQLTNTSLNNLSLEKIHNADSDPYKKYLRFNKTFIQQFRHQLFSGFTMPLNKGLPALLALTNMKPLKYFSANSDIEQSYGSIKTHPFLRKTQWSNTIMFFNGKRVYEPEENDVDDDLEMTFLA